MERYLLSSEHLPTLSFFLSQQSLDHKKENCDYQLETSDLKLRGGETLLTISNSYFDQRSDPTKQSVFSNNRQLKV